MFPPIGDVPFSVCAGQGTKRNGTPESSGMPFTSMLEQSHPRSLSSSSISLPYDIILSSPRFFSANITSSMIPLSAAVSIGTLWIVHRCPSGPRRSSVTRTCYGPFLSMFLILYYVTNIVHSFQTAKHILEKVQLDGMVLPPHR